MGSKENVTERDRRLSIISREVIKNIPCVESIILCGSRAIIQGTKPSSMPSDYDVAIVIKTPLIPLYLRRIKVVENRLSKEFGFKVNLNPLPTFRIRNAKGNLFLFKVKKEAITIWGKDYVSMLNPGCIKDIGTDWYFSYLCSLMKEFVQNFDPSFIHEFSGKHRRQSINGATKALLGCGELLLLLRGTYETQAKAIVNKLSEYGYKEVSSNGFIVDAVFLNSFHVALNTKWDPAAKVADPLEFCLSAKNFLLEMFRILMRYFYGSRTHNWDKLVTEYMKAAKGKSLLKNTEYSTLTFLMKKEVFPKALFGMSLVVYRMRAALVWLLATVDEDKCLCRETLDKAYHALKGYVRIRYSNDDVALWRNIKHAILTYWPYACTVMGFQA